MTRTALLCCLLCCPAALVCAQKKCPSNIGFEDGNFNGWECKTGTIHNLTGEILLTTSDPTWNRQTMYSLERAFAQRDMYGGFPVVCPNGSDFSIMLGNASAGAQAEQVSYTFTIPPDDNNYSIVYHYAVVFQNPGHDDWEQPAFSAKVMDLGSGSYIGCSSFSYTASASLPGFKQSQGADSVFYKEWTPVTIKLSGMAGKSIRLEFTTNDCSKGGHFGYAYVDVNQNCASPITGNISCGSSMNNMTLIAPYGFETYRWFNADFSQELSQRPTLTMAPAPPVGTVIALQVTPYPDQGCLDTLYTTIEHSPEALQLVLRKQITACESTGAELKDPALTAGTGNNVKVSFFGDFALTSQLHQSSRVMQTQYVYVLGENEVGCIKLDSIHVMIEKLPAFAVDEPAPVTRPAAIDLTQTITPVNGNIYHYTYWRDSLFANTVKMPEAVKESGRYFIRGESTVMQNCYSYHGVNVTIKEPPISAPNAFSPNGDGIHDQWRIPQLAYYPECVVDIYDRYGKLLYRSQPGYPVPWDGTHKQKILPIGTYYYLITLDGKLPPVSGSITLFR